MGDRLINNVDHTKQDREADQSRKASAHGIIMFLLIKLHHLFIKLFPVVFIFALQRIHLRLKNGRFHHGLLLLDRQGKLQCFGNNGKQDQSKSIVFYNQIAHIHNPAERPAEYSINKIHSLSSVYKF